MPSNIKVAHLTSVHSRFDTRIFIKECNSLANNGYAVSLVVADGKGDETKNNVKIFDVGASKGRLDRIRNAPERVLAKALDLDADIYHLHDPELIPIGLKLKNSGEKVIFDIHENTDLQILDKEWIPIYLRRFISWLYSRYEIYACKKFDALIVPQIAMLNKFKKFSKTELIANFPTNIIENIHYKDRSKFDLLYVGGLSQARGLYNMLDLIEILSSFDARYKLTLAGPISPSDHAAAKIHPGWKNTVYLGVLNREELYNVYGENSIGLILFNNVGQYYMSYALKLFEYMQCGLTVIMPNFGDWVSFNKERTVGYNVDPSDSDTIAQLVDNLEVATLKDIFKHNSAVAKNDFLWSSEERKLISLYRSL
ncbi:glycosyltransferase [Salinivibrio sp. IB872]|uniref:glycosyltransferase n=1 Tax=Salinivibrio sp. IB872 TaxID=1766123 RepID=UPI000984D9C5|nr:glycosyltransferase [Salinivibrio sp. IB872]OOF20763.1 hypothetical protein BZJ18_16635 [Salinivibrio sp. IB872]